MMSYSPSICSPTEYTLAFIANSSNQFQVHGLWPENCAEDTENSGYPSCCYNANLFYEEPLDPTNFLRENWFNSTSTDSCLRNEKNNNDKVPLFQHEWSKHGICMNATTTEYLALTADLFSAYYDKYVVGQCPGSQELWLSLDGRSFSDDEFEAVRTECK